VVLVSLPADLSTLRLRLPLITPDERDDMLAGRSRPHWHPDYPRGDDRDAASMIPAAGPEPWGPRHIVRASDGLVVGSIGFFGPPLEVAGTPEVEVGYGLVEEARGHGAATEALRGVLAVTDRVGVRVRAGVRPENTASIRVLAKCGFTGLRGTDEDGGLVMVRPLPRP
jgi:RimJ/RimL family protein N-acetyltransferase